MTARLLLSLTVLASVPTVLKVTACGAVRMLKLSRKAVKVNLLREAVTENIKGGMGGA